MHVFAQTSWLLILYVGTVVVAAATSNTSGVVEIDLVFPRNDTYAPTPLLPIIFAFQNPELVSFLNPQISFTIWDWDNKSETVVTTQYNLLGTNFSGSEPQFIYRGFTGFNTEGSWWLTWSVAWESCIEDSSTSSFGGDAIISNNSGSSIFFTTKDGGQIADIVAATHDNKDCLVDTAVTINVTDTIPVHAGGNWDGGETCVVVASSTPTPDPCRVKIDSLAASSISSSITASACRGTDLPVSCPPENGNSKSTSQRLAVGSVACLAAAFGALGYIMV